MQCKDSSTFALFRFPQLCFSIIQLYLFKWVLFISVIYNCWVTAVSCDHGATVYIVSGFVVVCFVSRLYGLFQSYLCSL